MDSIREDGRSRVMLCRT